MKKLSILADIRRSDFPDYIYTTTLKYSADGHIFKELANCNAETQESAVRLCKECSFVDKSPVFDVLVYHHARAIHSVDVNNAIALDAILSELKEHLQHMVDEGKVFIQVEQGGIEEYTSMDVLCKYDSEWEKQIAQYHDVCNDIDKAFTMPIVP